MRICRIAGCALALVVLGGTTAAAQELDSVLTLSFGTGQSLGGSSNVVKKPSPVFLEVDVGLIFDGDTSLEWTPSLIFELTGRVAVGVNPSLKKIFALDKPKHLSAYGGIGFPTYIAPFTLFGVEAAVGAFYRFYSRFSAVLELRTHVFFAGSDLPSKTALAKLDFALGVRVDL